MEQKPIKKQRKYKSILMLIGITTASALSAFYYGYCITYFNAIPYKQIVKIYEIQSLPKKVTQGLITASINFTAAFGTLVSAETAARLSCRQCMLVLSFVSMILSTIVLIPNIWILALVRLGQGLIIGMITSITPWYVSQVIPKTVAGPFWCYHQCLVIVGITSSYVVTSIFSKSLPPQIYWRFVFGFPLVTSAVQFISFLILFRHESPKYLIAIKDSKRAYEAIKFIYKQKFVQQIYQEVQLAVKYVQKQDKKKDKKKNNKSQLQRTLSQQIQLKPIQSSNQSIKYKKFNASLDHINSPIPKTNKPYLSSLDSIGHKNELSVQNKKAQQQQYKQGLMNKPFGHQLVQYQNQKERRGQGNNQKNNRTALLLAMILAVQQPFMGGFCVVNYPGDLIQGVFPERRESFPILTNSLGIIGAFVSICILNKVGRRKIIVYSTLVQSILLWSASVLCYIFIDYSQPKQTPYNIRLLTTYIFIAMRVVLSSTFTPVCDIYLVQIIQGKATDYATTLQWLSTAIAMTIFPMLCGLGEHNNPTYGFAFFGALTLLFFFADYRLAIQTKSKSQIQIRAEYDKMFPSRHKIDVK